MKNVNPYLALTAQLIIYSLLSTLFVKDACHAQILTKAGRYYHYDNQFYQKTELADIFAPSLVATEYYEEALEARKQLKRSVITTVCAAGLTALVAILGTKVNDFPGAQFFYAVAGISSSSVFVVYSFISLYDSADYNENINSAVYHYNKIYEVPINSETSSLHLGLSQYGIGLRYQF